VALSGSTSALRRTEALAASGIAVSGSAAQLSVAQARALVATAVAASGSAAQLVVARRFVGVATAVSGSAADLSAAVPVPSTTFRFLSPQRTIRREAQGTKVIRLVA